MWVSVIQFSYHLDVQDQAFPRLNILALDTGHFCLDFVALQWNGNMGKEVKEIRPDSLEVGAEFHRQPEQCDRDARPKEATLLHASEGPLDEEGVRNCPAVQARGKDSQSRCSFVCLFNV